MFRSEDMTLTHVYFHKDTAKQAMTLIGEEKICEFINLQANKKQDTLLFTKDVRNLEKILNRVTFLEQETLDVCLKDSSVNNDLILKTTSLEINDSSEENDQNEEKGEDLYKNFYDKSSTKDKFTGGFSKEQFLSGNISKDTLHKDRPTKDRFSKDVFESADEMSRALTSDGTSLPYMNSDLHKTNSPLSIEERFMGSRLSSSKTPRSYAELGTGGNQKESSQWRSVFKESNNHLPSTTYHSPNSVHNTTISLPNTASSHPSLATNNHRGFDGIARSIKQHYERLIYLKDIRKETIAKIRTIAEDLHALEQLDGYLASTTEPDTVDEVKIALDFVCFAVDKEKAAVLEKVLAGVLRRNILVFRSVSTTNSKFDLEAIMNLPQSALFVAFTHGAGAIKKIKLICESLGARLVSDAAIRHGPLQVAAALHQAVRVFGSNERTLAAERKNIRMQVALWKCAVIRELRVFVAMNGLLARPGTDCLVGQAWVLSAQMSRLHALAKMVTAKHGYLSITTVKEYSDEKEGRKVNNKDKNENITDTIDISSKDVNESNISSNFHIVNVLETSNASSLASKNTFQNGLEFKPQYDSPHKELNKTYLKGSTEFNNSVNKQHYSNKNNHITSNRNTVLSKNDFDNSVSQNINSKVNSKTEFDSIDNFVDQDIISSDITLPKGPPTYIQTTKFTQAFQDVCDVYGVPSFKELNPAAFYITTFPFMFGCMFGDVFHGIILLIISLYLIKNESKLKITESLTLIFNGRYIMLLCACWSIFFGIIYSDFASIPISTFSFLNLKTYPLGIDPKWHRSHENGMLFMNSLKMKLSIVLGYCHMSLGLILNLFNCIFKNDKTHLFCVLIPQFISFNCFVGYLVFLIYYKWLFDCKFSIVTVFVNMFSQPIDLVVDEVFIYQSYVQRMLLCCIVICVPWMLVSKPLLLTLKQKIVFKNKKSIDENDVIMLYSNNKQKKFEEGSNISNGELNNENSNIIHESNHKKGFINNNASYSNEKKYTSDDSNNASLLNNNINANNTEHTQVKNKQKEEQQDDEHSIIDIWMHQGIETIEFIIGLISNTSSYLRLWAISLAHAQLSLVLHTMTIGSGFSLYLIFYIPLYLLVTLSLLIGLEGLSSCLHALRLNWIEFNGKFYCGSGYKFKPLCFDITEDD